jgi:hypothetical protein
VDVAFKAEDIDLSEAKSEAQSLEQQLAQIDQAADPESFKAMSDKLKVAQVKMGLAS